MKNIAIIFVRVLSLYYLVEFVKESIPQIIGITNSGQPMRTAMVGYYYFIYQIPDSYIFLGFCR